MTYVGVVGLGRGMVTGGSVGLSMGWSFVAAGLVFRAGDGIGVLWGGLFGGS